VLETCKKQETDLWQGGRAVLESSHMSVLRAEDAAARGPHRSGRSWKSLPLFPSTQVLTAEK